MPVARPRAVEVLVPAKLNLHLSVGDVRPDGYHELVTVFHAVGMCDQVIARPADALSLSIEGEGEAGEQGHAHVHCIA